MLTINTRIRRAGCRLVMMMALFVLFGSQVVQAQYASGPHVTGPHFTKPAAGQPQNAALGQANPTGQVAIAGQSTVARHAQAIRQAASNQTPGKAAPAGPVQQVSLAEAGGIVAARLEASRATQLRVTVQFLSIDDQTREAIYHDLGPESVKTMVTKVPQPATQHATADDENEIQMSGSRIVQTTSHVSTSVLDPSDVEKLLGHLVSAPESKVIKAPSVLLLDGRSAEYSDIAQRPFVVGVESKSGALSPVVQVLDEGTRIHMRATLNDWHGEGLRLLRLRSDVSFYAITDVQSKQLFGIETDSTAVQVPKHEVKMASVTEQLAEGQSLLIDPYLTQRITVRKESSVPMLKKIPYLSRGFKNEEVASTENNLMILLQPKL